MGAFSYRRGLFGSGLRDTRSEEERRAQLDALLGKKPWDAGAAMGDILGAGRGPGANPYGVALLDDAAGQAGAMGVRPALPDFSQDKKRLELPDSTNVPRAPVDGQREDLSDLVGTAPQRNRFGGNDILAGLLAAVGDAFSNRAGQRGSAVEMLGRRWAERGEAFDKASGAFQDRQRIASLPGMTRREMVGYMANPQAWGSHMSGAATSPWQAATLNPGDQRYLGPKMPAYQAPTRGELYAKSLGLKQGESDWNTAVQDQELGAQGPTAFSHARAMEAGKNAHAVQMERLRQSGRLGLEGAKQGGREKLRGMPLPGRVSSAAPRKSGSAVTATGPNGEQIFYRGGRWVDAAGRPVQ